MREKNPVKLVFTFWSASVCAKPSLPEPCLLIDFTSQSIYSDESRERPCVIPAVCDYLHAGKWPERAHSGPHKLVANAYCQCLSGTTIVQISTTTKQSPTWHWQPTHSFLSRPFIGCFHQLNQWQWSIHFCWVQLPVSLFSLHSSASRVYRLIRRRDCVVQS